MDDGEGCGVKGDAVDGAGMAAILAVSAHGVAQVVHVHTDLVLAASLYLQFYHGEAASLLDDAVACYGEPPEFLVVGGIHLKGVGVLGEETFDGAFFLLHFAFNNGNVASVDDHVVPVADELVACLLGACEEHKSRGVAVEAVHDIHVGLVAKSARIFLHYIIYGIVAGFAGGCGEHAIAFIDYDDVVVLIHELDAWVAEDLEGAVEVYPQLVASSDWQVKLCGRHAIDCQLVVSQH